MRTLLIATFSLLMACGSDDPAPADISTSSAGGAEGVTTDSMGAGVGGAGGADGVGGAAGDSDASVAEGGDEAVPCGSKTCNAGEYCCDGSCGACVAVGTNCPPDPCPSDGASTEADSTDESTDGATGD